MGEKLKRAAALDELVQALARKIEANAATPAPKLRLVKPPKPALYDSITRDCCLRRVQFLARAFRLQWLVDQATFNMAGLHCLEDQELSSLLAAMERARECMEEGIPLEDAGLVVNLADRLPR